MVREASSEGIIKAEGDLNGLAHRVCRIIKTPQIPIRERVGGAGIRHWPERDLRRGCRAVHIDLIGPACLVLCRNVGIC